MTGLRLFVIVLCVLGCVAAIGMVATGASVWLGLAHVAVFSFVTVMKWPRKESRG